jgi:uncharacterized membrane protein YeaQ/YmgE (transglycosylase-associated protein family)
MRVCVTADGRPTRRSKGDGTRDDRGRKMATLEQIQPYAPAIVMVVNGLIAGWLASLLFAGGGLMRDVAVGIVGAFVGGALVHYDLIALPATVTNLGNALPYGTQILISTIGASLVILVARLVSGR